jgi:hypothetical protein
MGREGVGISGWRVAVDDVTAEVECGGSIHTVVWRRGKLVLVDHDLQSEATMVALGGEPPPCVQVLYAWRRARRTARFVQIDDETINYFRARNLTLGDKFQAALLPESLRQLRERTTWLNTLRTRAEGARVFGSRTDLPGKSLVTAIRRLAENTLDRLVDPLRSFIPVEPSAKVLPRGAPPSALGRPGGGGRIQLAEVFLPPEWLATVGLLEVAEVDGRFVLAVDEPNDDVSQLDATVVEWRTTPTGRLAADITCGRLVRADGRWNLRE